MVQLVFSFYLLTHKNLWVDGGKLVVLLALTTNNSPPAHSKYKNMQQFTDYKSEIIAPMDATIGFITILGLNTPEQLLQNKTLGVTNFSNLNMSQLNTQLLLYVKGSASIQVSFSPDNINYYYETSDDYNLDTGEITQTPIIRTTTSNSRIAIPICDRYIKIEIIDGTCGITAILGNN